MIQAAAPLDDADRALLLDLLKAYESGPELPQVQRFRVAHEAERSRIDRLRRAGLLEDGGGRYVLTLAGLRACDSKSARHVHARCSRLLELLQQAYRADPTKLLSAEQFGLSDAFAGQEVARLIPLLRELPVWETHNLDPKTGFAVSFRPSEGILDVEPLVWSETSEVAAAATPDTFTEPKITSIEISGYRPFSGFSATPGDLTVVIGANAAGKSSLFDVLRLLKSAVLEPLPPEIDRNNLGKVLFHAGGPELIQLAFTMDVGQKEALRYELTIRGPAGAPQVARERLATEELPGKSAPPPFVFLDFTNGHGVVRDRSQKAPRAPWTLPPNELALRRALDPTLVTLSRVQAFVSSWSFYSGFDVSQAAEIRRPAYIEENPTLAPDGANLSAVLSWMRDEHADAWEELQLHLRNLVPGFVSLGLKARGAKGMTIGVWREEGLKEELTLADLSDGTLRLLCWLSLALSPRLPPLVCIDEPEIGLHPRVLPVLAGVLKLAAARAQLLIATHSPHFLSQFDLDDIAVMRKEDARAVFLRPSTSHALRNEVREIGGDALARLFLSRELEVLP